MNDPGGPPPDWDSIFRQARRRMAGKLLVVALLAAGGSMLLLGGGLQAEGAVELPIPFLNKSDRHKEEQKDEKPHREQQSNRRHQKQNHEKQGDHGQPKPKPGPKPCKEESKTSAEGEYGRWDGGNESTGGKCPSGKSN